VDFGGLVASGELVIYAEFTEYVASNKRGGPRVVTGSIEIDADQDPSTGLTSTIDGASGLGVDYTVTMVENEDGLYAISDSNQVVTAWVEPTFNSSVWGSVTVAVPLSALGGDVGNVNLAAAFGTLNERTDIVPNASHVVVALLSPQ
jgi:hypothetical protein